MPGIDFEKSLAQRKAIRSHLDAIGRKILVMSGKGGVGKTTVTVNLASKLADLGFKVGIMDTDLHGPNVAKMLGVEHVSPGSFGPDHAIKPILVHPGLVMAGIDTAMENPGDPIVWRGPMKTAVINELLARVDWGPLDFLFFDTPPGTGDEQITLCKSVPELTGAIIVTTAQEVALLDSRRSIAFCRKMGIAILGVVENMSGLRCPCCGTDIPLFGVGGGEKMAAATGTPFLGRIPLEVSLREAGDTGEDYGKQHSDSPSAQSFTRIAVLLSQAMTCSGVQGSGHHA
jgi:Mrp family chromosome partitioning ATPase